MKKFLTADYSDGTDFVDPKSTESGPTRHWAHLDTVLGFEHGEIRDLEAAQSASRQRLEALFQSMLHRAFNGEL